ncbi:BZ3500_MvSof-1268-A1-R1_Chr1-2g01433 [Microbotryum saponariae]|uniref:BZ3500_MvSof-1268-A1-R1_Chr1-2g01433 protein n=1 Tax=Microbotryum saponariae TaxID=289078 RepID=A0A2X0KU29_9BASI|nr:BZ3500_MvSof-1268-A1-R1_Chr1-2g01433 [Microbotryum saponariae]SCZ97422.1 BZ3501_MvSof-1269-A2-R1_Chr1-2g01032 [Microbotryum saponariae]
MAPLHAGSTPSSPTKRSTTPSTASSSSRSRTASPTKSSSSSLHRGSETSSTSSSLNSSVRPSSRAAQGGSNIFPGKTNSKLSSSVTPSSPSKRESGLGLLQRTTQPSSSTSTLRQQASSSSIPRLASKYSLLSDRNANAGDGLSESDGDTSFTLSQEGFSEEDEEDSADERQRSIKPVRRAGFGARPVLSFASSEASSRRSVSVFTDDESAASTYKNSSAGDPAREDGDDAEGDEEESVDGKAVNVVVCLRVRPTRMSNPSSNIYKYNAPRSVLSFAPNHPVFVKRGATSSSRPGEYEFTFDRLHLAPAPSEALYDAKIRPIVRAAMNGFNGTVFAYGQTASGKTHTMMGTEAEPGIIPLAIDELFTFIHRVSGVASTTCGTFTLILLYVQQNDSRSFSLRVSFLEIYNEQLRDLLISNPKSTKPLEVVGEDGTVKGLEERPVAMPSEVLSLLHEGDQRRRVGATDWNERSSRSHSVFVVTIESMPRNGAGMARTSRLNLIDLAGSESATGQDDRRKEGSFINKSLLTLGTVIGKLSEGKHAGAQHIPYRDSKLTRLLQPALSGKSRVAVICTMSPDAEQATETLSTLKFARRAKMVVTKAERGVLMTEQMMLNMYEKQVEALKQQIAQRESAVEESELAKERDLAAARADEYESRSKKAEDELALKELELTRLREQLEHTKSFILTGPVLEANARRVSVGGATFHNAALSPSRAKRIVSDMGGFNSLGLGTPKGSRASFRSGSNATQADMSRSESGSLEREHELERQLDEANRKLAELETVSAEAESLRTKVVELQRSVSLARVNAETSATDRKERVRELEERLQEARDQLRDADEAKEAAANKQTELNTLRQELEEAQLANTQLATAKVRGEEAATSLATLLETTRAELAEAKLVVDDKSVELEKKSRAMLDLEAKAREATKQLNLAQKTSQDAIAELEKKLIIAQEAQKDTMQRIEGELGETKQDLETSRKRTVELEERLVNSRQGQKESTVRLEKELEFAKAALEAAQVTIAEMEQTLVLARQSHEKSTSRLAAELAAARTALEQANASNAQLVSSVEEEATLARKERDLALDAATAAQTRVAELEADLNRRDEELAAAKTRIVDDKQALETKSALILKLTTELASVQRVLTEREAKMDHLQRLVDQHIKREADMAQYEANRRAGTDSLQARLAAMQQSSASKSSTGLSSSQRSAKSSSGLLAHAGRFASGKDLETVDELRVRNGELVNRIEELERMLELSGGGALNRSTRSSTPVPGLGTRRSGSIDLAKVVGPAETFEKKELNSIIDTQKKELTESQAAPDRYRLKYLAAQKLLDKLTASVEPSSLRPELHDPRSPFESPRSSLAELNGSSENRRPTLPSRTTTSSSPSSTSSNPITSMHHLGRSTWTRDQPPPLPCSPRNADKERQHRRVTIGKEIEQLKQAKEVLKKREGFDTPPSSPTKLSSARFGDDGFGTLRSRKDLFD